MHGVWRTESSVVLLVFNNNQFNKGRNKGADTQDEGVRGGWWSCARSGAARWTALLRSKERGVCWFFLAQIKGAGCSL
jgi:hypothetical protein